MLLITYGTRPEYIKVKPVMDEMDRRGIEYKTLYVMQHENLVEKRLCTYYMDIMDFGNRLDSIVGSVMSKMSVLLYASGVTHVMVQGDTTTAFAVAMAANHNHIPVIHLEAGLRTYDNANPWPEEQNRRMISMLAQVHLCPTEYNRANILFELPGSTDIHVVGNTVIDGLTGYKDECEYLDKVVVTMHRRENHAKMREWFDTIEELARIYDKLDFIIPIHLNPDVYRHHTAFTMVNVIDPLDRDGFLSLLSKARIVITDSGGVQEECSFLNKKCIVCRKVTERPEAVGKSSFLASSPDELMELFDEHVDDYDIDYVCPFGDGNSAKSVVNILQELK